MRGELTAVLKTKGSRRTVKIFPELREALLPFEYCKPDVRLFDFKPEYVTKKFTAFCRSKGIPDFSLKSCRTTFATRCEERGIPEPIIQSWLGHTSYKTTKQHYVKLNSEFIEAEFEKAVQNDIKNNPFRVVFGAVSGT